MLSNSVKFSVIIPVFNAEKFLDDCLDSLDAQSYEYFEVICIDDGSSDGSLKILNQKSKIDSRYRVLSQENSGVAVARNKALDYATGDYILFLDSDDWLHPKGLEWLASEVLCHGFPEMIVFPYISVMPHKEERSEKWAPFVAKFGTKVFSFQDVGPSIVYGPGLVAGRLFKNELLNKNNIRFSPQLKNGEDMVFAYTTYALCKRIAIMNRAIYYYRQGFSANSLTLGHISLLADSLNYALDKLTVYYPEEVLIDRFLSAMLYAVSRPDYQFDNSSYEIIKTYYERLKASPEGRKTKNFRSIEAYIKKNSSFRRLRHKILKKQKINGHKRWFVFGKPFLWTEIRDYERWGDVDKNYEKNIRRIKEKIKNGKRIKVAFLISELAKIKTKSLMLELLRDPIFEPYVLITTLAGVSYNTERPVLKAIESFCQELNIPFQRAYDPESGQAFESENFEFDILFYQAPWSLHGSYKVGRVSQRALTCYVPYFVPNYGFGVMDCQPAFHEKLFRYYVLNENYQAMYEEKMPTRNGQLRSVGHTMLDEYLLEKEPEKKDYVIYAPHWSIGLGPEKYSTFIWSGFFMLRFAQEHPEINWVFKPHPTLKRELLKKALLSEEQIQDYYEAWGRVGVVSQDSNYLNLFRASKCLITDCGSFLVEYFPTKNPVIRLVSNLAIQPCSALKKILKHYYWAYDPDELDNFLRQVVIDGLDPKKEQRVVAVDGFLGKSSVEQTAAQKIHRDLLEVFQDRNI